MSSRLAVVWLLLALAVPSALLASLQHDVTNRFPPATEILPSYADGAVSQEMLGTGQVSIMRARCFVRGLLVLCLAVGGPHLEGYNLTIQFLAVWAALGLVYLTATRLLPPFAAGAAALVAAGFVPWGFLRVGYDASWPYDLPSLAFAALGTWAVVTRRFVPLAVVLTVGTVNKETVVFLLPAYLLATWPHLPRRVWMKQALVLLVLFAVAYEIPRIAYTRQHLPTATFSAYDVEGPRWFANLDHLRLRIQSFPLENIYWAFTLHVVPLLGWRALPRELRALYLCAPVLLVPIFFVGNIYELRLYNELIPLGAVGTVLVLWRKSGLPPRAAPESVA